MMNDTLCRIFDLCLSVPFPVGKELQAPDNTPVDVRVTLEQTPRSLSNVIHRSTLVDVGMRVEVDNQANVLIHVSTTCLYITGGNAVLVDADPALTSHMIRDMVFRHCIPVLLNQRGALTLHANALSTPRGAIALVGASGSGKSTLHAALLARGIAMLSDDVAVLCHSKDGYKVLPGMRRYSMTADAWERMQPPADRVIPLNGPRKKVALWAPPQLLHPQPTLLAAIYLIEPYDESQIVVDRLQGVAAFQSLQAQAYLPLGAMALPQHISSFSMLIERVAIYRIRRPAGCWTVDKLVDIVLSSDPLSCVLAHG